MKLATDQEREFIVQYNLMLKGKQSQLVDYETAYTKISLTYAIQHNLCILNLCFHPLSTDKHKSYTEPDIHSVKVKKVLKEIILYELSQELPECKLTTLELTQIINHYRTI